MIKQNRIILMSQLLGNSDIGEDDNNTLYRSSYSLINQFINPYNILLILILTYSFYRSISTKKY